MPAKKPTKLKLLQGTQKITRINPDEPDPEVVIPSCPAWLDRNAKIEWRRLTPLLEELGLIAKINRAALIKYCATYSRWIKAEKMLHEEGEVLDGVVFNKRGEKMIVKRKNPWVDIAIKCAQVCGTLEVQFGMTPASQGKVSSKPPGDKKKDLERRKERFFK